MTSATYIARSSAIASRVLAGETMVMSVVDSTFFTLNEVASAIWSAADGVTPLHEIVARDVCPEFEVPVEEALTDAREFVRELSTYGILRVSDEPILPSAAAGVPGTS
jgi:phosphohistidine swiveling domain-containing protein